MLELFLSIDYVQVAALKAGLAAAGSLLLVWTWIVPRGRTRRSGRLRDIGLACVGVLCFAGWWNFGRLQFGAGYLHLAEFFHYYLNAKYFPELRYEGLYECAAAVEVEQGHRAEVAQRWIRDLRTNELRRGVEVLESAARCRERLVASGRWNEFAHDVAWFRAHLDPRKRADVFADHGYNATPVWSIAGRLLADTGPVSWHKVLILALLDPVLLLAMWALVWWAFGWRVLCVALIWWGTNYPARFSYIGGAFLRQDWLLLAVGAICLARRGWMAAAGFALTWSALLRIFPGFIVLGLVLKAALEAWQTRTLRIQPAHVRFAGGALAAILLLVPLSLTVAGERHQGFSIWTEFAGNSSKLLSTPLTNHVGLPVVVAFDPSNRSAQVRRFWVDAPWDVWKEGRRRTFEQRRGLYLMLVLAFIGLLVRAVRQRDDWEALVLGIGVVPVFTELTCYYYGLLLGFAFLWPRHAIAGTGLALTALLSALTPALVAADDDRYTVISALLVGFVALVTVTVGRRTPATAMSSRGSGDQVTEYHVRPPH